MGVLWHMPVFTHMGVQRCSIHPRAGSSIDINQCGSECMAQNTVRVQGHVPVCTCIHTDFNLGAAAVSIQLLHPS